MNATRPAGTAVLFSSGLDSAVLLAEALGRPETSPSGNAAAGRAGSSSSVLTRVTPIYVNAGLAWERNELAAARRLLHEPPYAGRILPLVSLQMDMRDVYPETHWAVRGVAPGYDTPDEDVYIQG